MASSNLPTFIVKRAAHDPSSTYIALGIVFGAIALVCLLITAYLLIRLKRDKRKMDREIAQEVSKEDFAPQFRDKSIIIAHAHDEYPRARAPVPPPSLPADIIQSGGGITPPLPGSGFSSPMPQRPERRPSSLFDQQRHSHTPRMPGQSFAEQQDYPPMMPEGDVNYMPPMWQAPLPAQYQSQQQYNDAGEDDPELAPPRMPQAGGRPESSYSIYSAYYGATTAGTEAPPLQAGRQSFHRSPSLLRKLLADRAAKSGPPPPVPAIPQPQPHPQPQPVAQPRATRPETSMMPYDLEDATPGPTPIDVPPVTAVSPVAVMRRISEATEDPFVDQDPHSAARLTLLQPPPSPPRRSPPPLSINIPNSHLKGMNANGVPQPGESITTPPPVFPSTSPERPNPIPKPVKKKPVLQAPPPPPTLPPLPPSYAVASRQPQGEPDLRATVTPNVLAAFAARLRPETRDFNAEPVAVPDVRDASDFRITMRP